ncbi:unnamed protein product [Sphacelaria rigidula]
MNLQPSVGITPIEAPTREPTPITPAPVSERPEVEEVLIAGEDKPSSTVKTAVDTSPFKRAIQMLTNASALKRAQEEDPFLGQVRSILKAEKEHCTNGEDGKDGKSTMSADEVQGTQYERCRLREYGEYRRGTGGKGGAQYEGCRLRDCGECQRGTRGTQYGK